MTLSTLAILIGAAYCLPQLYALAKPRSFTEHARAFPRCQISGFVLMGLGTAITVATLATIAVGAKGLARRIGGADSAMAGAVVWWAELGGAAAVLGFGILLLIASF